MTVIGLDPVIAVAFGALPTNGLQTAFTLQLSNRSWITTQTVSSKHVRRAIVRISQCIHQKQLRGFSIVMEYFPSFEKVEKDDM